MEDEFKIYVDRLKHGEVEQIEEQLDPGFLMQDDEELSFKHAVDIQGEAYVAEKELVLHLNSIETIATLPCTICSEPTETPLQLKGLYHVVPLAEIKSGIFNLKEYLRETIILEAPRFVECHEGKCPERKNFEQFLKKEKPEDKDEGYHPFSEL